MIKKILTTTFLLLLWQTIYCQQLSESERRFREELSVNVVPDLNNKFKDSIDFFAAYSIRFNIDKKNNIILFECSKEMPKSMCTIFKESFQKTIFKINMNDSLSHLSEPTYLIPVIIDYKAHLKNPNTNIKSESFYSIVDFESVIEDKNRKFSYRILPSLFFEIMVHNGYKRLTQINK